MRVKYAVSAMNMAELLHSVHSDSRSTQEMVLGKAIEFYVPTIFHKPSKGALQQQCTKVIEFCTQPRESA